MGLTAELIYPSQTHSIETSFEIQSEQNATTKNMMLYGSQNTRKASNKIPKHNQRVIKMIDLS
jgi:hypothetical protein